MSDLAATAESRTHRDRLIPDVLILYQTTGSSEIPMFWVAGVKCKSSIGVATFKFGNSLKSVTVQCIAPSAHPCALYLETEKELNELRMWAYQTQSLALLLTTTPPGIDVFRTQRPMYLSCGGYGGYQTSRDGRRKIRHDRPTGRRRSRLRLL